MTLPDIIGWAGNIAFICGVFLLARKHREGFYFDIVGNSGHLVMAVMTRLTSLIAISIILIGLNIYGLIRWGRGER